MVLLLLTAVVALAPASAQVLPLTIDNVEIDDVDVQPDEVNRLDLERGHTYDVEVRLTAMADVDDVEVEAFVSGFEYNDISRISDAVHVFDADAGVTYVKRMKVTMPDDIEEDDYKLRVIVSDRNSDAIIQNYNLKLDVPRHAVQIDDIILFPNPVEAGKALLATVRVENKGEKDEDDVRVTVSIPNLGVSGVDYIEEIEEEEEEETEEIFLRIPSNTQSGLYTVKVDVHYDELNRVISENRVVEIRGGATEEKAVLPQTVVNVGNAQATATSGGAAGVYSLTVTNNERSARVYSLSLEGADWAEVSVSPSSAAIVQGGQSQVFTLTVAPREDAEVGTKVFTATLKQGNEVLQQVPLTAEVREAEASWSEVAFKTLGIVIVVLLAVLVVLGLVLAVRKLGEEDELSAEAYY